MLEMSVEFYKNDQVQVGELIVNAQLTDDFFNAFKFTNLGFSWGGDWERGIKDFQHFEKPIA